MMRRAALLPGFLVLAASAVILGTAVSATPPNVILIVADDLGYGDLGCYGATGQSTPQIDRMAAEGMRFTDFYVSGCVCSPSRASIQTGCYHKRISINRVLWPVSRSGMNENEVTIAEVLKTRGYATCYYGKWHLGDQKEFLPTRQGYDHFHGIPYSHDMKSLVRLKKEEGKLSPLRTRVVPVMRDEKVEQLVKTVAPLMEVYENEIEAFIEECHHTGKPFFVMLAHHAVHLPNEPPAQFSGQSRNGEYGDWVQEIDFRTGQLLQKIRTLGLADRTVVFFTSDNGPSARNSGSAGPLRGYKHTTWEGGVRVPLIVWGPGRIPVGSTSHAIAASMDLLPTIATLSGSGTSSALPIDGVDLSPLFSAKPGSVVPPPRDEFVYYQGADLAAIRKGPWKLHLEAPERPGIQLFNLDEDIGESKNLAESQPDVVAQLGLLADHYREVLGDGKKEGSGERAAGRARLLEPLFDADSHPKDGDPMPPGN